MAKISGGKAKIEPFLTGLLDTEKNEFYGRPSYVFQMKDGSLLVSDETRTARSIASPMAMRRPQAR